MLNDPTETFEALESDYRGAPVSRSRELWNLRRAVSIAAHNRSPETILEKAVANLAERRHMPGYYNQCPIVSGIFGSHAGRRSAVDLVHWSEGERRARLIELKWVGRGESGDPASALSQVLCYGVVYLFCRIHRRELPLRDRPIMDARQVALEVAAPPSFYAFDDGAAFIAEANGHLARLAESKTGGALSMSLTALSFPDEFQELPFSTGGEMLSACGRYDLTGKARQVRDAFAALSAPGPGGQTR